MFCDPGPPRHALGVDFGTSNTVAVARWPDGRSRPILIDGSPLLPSAVYAEPAGQLIVGRDAVHSARLDPARFEPNPKRRIDDGTVLLGEHEVPVGDLFAAVLARVAEQWHRAVGPVPPGVTLTCPATWGATRRSMLADAAASAGLNGARLVAEPVAAATYFVEVLGRDLPIGSAVVVHHFGAGTFDASVVARTADGFEVLAVDGRDDIGGLDVDAAVVEHLGRTCAERDPATWQRLTSPSTVEERRAQRQLWDDVRVAKERLSRTQRADLVIPLFDLEMHLPRAELEQLAEPVIAQTVEATREVIRRAELAEGRLAGVFLVGGASRIPLVATMLHRALDEAPVVIEQPELVVAEGSILAAAALLATGPAAPGPAAPGPAAPGPAAPGPTSQPKPPTRLRTPAADARDCSGATAQVSVEPAPTPAVGGPGAAQEPAWSAPTEQVARPIDEPWPARRWDEAAAQKLHEELWPGGQPSDGADPEQTVPAVDPWPNATVIPWLDDPQRTVAHDPWGSDRDRWVGPSQETVPAAPAHRPRPPTPTPTPTHVAVGVQPQPVGAPPRPQRARRDRPKDRRGGGMHALQVLLSVVVLVGAPVVAAVAAYGHGNGLPLEQDAANVIRDLVRLVRDWGDGFTSAGTGR